MRRYLSPGKLEELAGNERIKAVLDTSSEYSDLDTAQRRCCGSCARSCKVLSRVARASRKVLTKHENELGEFAQLLCRRPASIVVNFTVPFVAVFLNERMSKLTDESVMASTWEDFAEGWLALLSWHLRKPS